jgi:hypothetical protein
LAPQGVGEGVKGIIVDVSDGDRGRKSVCAADAGEDGDVEASLEKLVEDAGAKIAGSLCDA